MCKVNQGLPHLKKKKKKKRKSAVFKDPGTLIDSSIRLPLGLALGFIFCS